MKTLLSLVAMAAVLFSVNPADACSMAPIDVDKAIAKSNLEPSVFAALNVAPENVTQFEITEKDGNYIWNNPMCPEGSWVSATYMVFFKQDMSDCVGSAKIKREIAGKVESHGVSLPAINRITVDILQTPVCTASSN